MHIRGIARNYDRVFRILQCAHRLKEHLRVRGLGPAAQVALVVQAYGQDLARLARVQQFHIGELVGNAGFGVAVEEAALDLAHRIAMHNAVSSARGGFKSNILGHVPIL
jgi:hypothetical protein